MPNQREPSGAAVLQESVTRAISTAMFDELDATGYARMSMETVARRAGVGKAAIYRRWPSKQAMLIDLVGDVVRRHVPQVPDTGSLAGDVRAFLDANVAQVGDPRIGRIVLEMLAETARSAELSATLRETAAPPRRAAAEALLRRAQQRGELPADLDHELGTDLLISPLVLRVLVFGVPADEDYLSRLTKVIVAGLHAASR